METTPNENLYKEVLQTMSECVIIHKRSGRMIALNENVEKVLGVKSELLTEANIRQLDYVKEDGSSLPYSELPGIITLEQGIPFHDYVLGVSDRNNGTKWLSITSKPLKLHEDGEQAALVTISDITERKKMEQTIIQAKEAAEKANLIKSDFLSKMSHELRTPLNGILGFAQLLEIDETLNEEQQDFVQEILSGGKHLLSLINDILDLSRIDTGHLKVSIEEVELQTIINECIKIVQPLAMKKRITILNQMDHSQTVTVLADPIRLKQILLNLLDNSIKYNREDGKVMIFSYMKQNEAVIHIADTGVGLSVEEYQKVFVPFYRIEGTHEEGTGIGLSLVKQLVQLMSGKISVASQKGIGSDFHFSLPLPYDLTTAMQWGEEVMDLPTKNPKSDHYGLLYVEDNESNLHLVKNILKSQPSYTILTARSGKEGLALARTEKVDLILLDLNLPDMHGYEVFDLIKQDEKTKDIAIIAVSANAMPQDIQQTLGKGFDNYVTKPVNVKEFLTTIYETLTSTINQNIPEHKILSTGPNGEEAVSAKTLQLSLKDLKKLREKNYTAAIAMHYTGNNWARAQIEGLKTTFNKMGIRVVAVTDAEFNWEKQVSDIQKILVKKPDIIVSLPIDPLSTAGAFQTAAQSGVKLVFMDNTPNGLEPGEDYVSVVSADNYGNGAYAADIMAEKIGFKGKIGVIYYDADFFVMKQRLTAFEKTIKESYPDIQIITRSGFTSPNDGKEITDAMLSQHLDLKGIFVVWDLVAEGAMASARAAGKHDLVITTMDLGTNAAVEIAKDGLIKGSGSQMPYHQGVAEAILAGYALLGKPAPAYVAVPALKVTKENLLEAWKLVYNQDPSELNRYINLLK
ncbi:substrate-binding domain-containing protein [Neobacillus cucumis]|uniref:histidine kinase n=1 Tax=Neobacillus cucumis TaxID=1740721 RepID=A0A2N5HCB3_9BACI|nr:substrate-binding domain-containing protein [Neobacillus cucumis]PLS03155.1 histidine kinase [Neobacillus cucumis]